MAPQGLDPTLKQCDDSAALLLALLHLRVPRVPQAVCTGPARKRFPGFALPSALSRCQIVRAFFNDGWTSYPELRPFWPQAAQRDAHQPHVGGRTLCGEKRRDSRRVLPLPTWPFGGTRGPIVPRAGLNHHASIEARLAFPWHLTTRPAADLPSRHIQVPLLAPGPQPASPPLGRRPTT